MGTSLTIFESAASALGTYSTALSVTGQNIANVNTPGYSRQRITQATLPTQFAGGINIGRGVGITSIQQIRDQFAELQLRNAYSDKGYATGSSTTLKQLETIFNEVNGDGLASFVTQFYNAWQDLANNPNSTSARLNLLSKSTIVIDRFNSLAGQFEDARSLIDQRVKSVAAEVNRLGSEIASVNGKILSSQGEALDLLDKRNVLVNELAEYVDVNVVDNGDGEYQVYIGTGLPLVSNVTSATVSTQADSGNDGLADITFSVGGSSALIVTDRFNNGELQSLLEVRDTNIPTYQSLLDEYAYKIATQVNTIHLTGFNLSSATSKYFFTNLASSTDAAANIALHSDVANTPTGIAASDTAANLPGGNAKALAIAALQNSTIAFASGNNTFSGFYGDLLARMGNDSQTSQRDFDFSETVLNQSTILREKISGVSIEEEQMNLIRYQTAFEASARLVSIAAEVLKTLVELGN